MDIIKHVLASPPTTHDIWLYTLSPTEIELDKKGILEHYLLQTPNVAVSELVLEAL